MKHLDSKSIILFDGVCNLCDGMIQFILKHDKRGTFCFASLQSDAGQILLREHGLSTDSFDTFVLLQGNKLWLRSDAALQVVRSLAPPLSWLYVLGIVPRPLRDMIYNIVAKNRYRWFGKRHECMRPGPDVESRFL